MTSRDEELIADLTALIKDYETTSNNRKIVGFGLRLIDIEKKGKRSSSSFHWDGEKFREDDK